MMLLLLENCIELTGSSSADRQETVRLQSLVNVEVGQAAYDLAAQIFPICRSITGPGVRETLGHVARHIDLKVHEVASGTQVFDWTVPREWSVAAASIVGPDGGKVVDFADSNLHVMSYSCPVDRTVSLAELSRHVFTLPDQPDLIPYRTSYYADDWGFCMAHRQFSALPPGDYRVRIDATLADGSLTYGEYLHVGETTDEVLLSAHVCHPSLANDNCSGIALLTHLAKQLRGFTTRLSYRFIFAPGTIGAITWLALNERQTKRIKHGLVVSCVGDGAGPVYKRSRQGGAPIDRAMAHVLRGAVPGAQVVEFQPYGYDERQYCSPGFDLPVGLFQRSQFGNFPEYHTSADNLDFIAPGHLQSSFETIVSALQVLEDDRRLLNTLPKCEPQLGRRGLYRGIGGEPGGPSTSMAYLWLLNLSDGHHSLLDIAERAKMPFAVVANAARRLEEHGLLQEVAAPDGQSLGMPAHAQVSCLGDERTGSGEAVR